MTQPEPIIENDEDDFSCFGSKKPKRPRSMRWKAHVATWFVKMTAKMFKIVLRLDVKAYNKGSIPKDMPVLCVGGPHNSFGDPPFWGATISRNGAIIAAEELTKIKFIGYFLRILFHLRGDILVARATADNDNKESRLAAFKKADNILAQGGLVAAFPEGGIRRDIWRKSLFGSALTHKAAIVVTRFEGVEDLWASTKADIDARNGKVFSRKAKLRISYSDPIYFEDYKHMSDVELAKYCHDISKSLIFC